MTLSSLDSPTAIVRIPSSFSLNGHLMSISPLIIWLFIIQSFIITSFGTRVSISTEKTLFSTGQLEEWMSECEGNSSQCLPPLIPITPLWLVSKVYKLAVCQLPSVLSPLLDRTFCLLNLPYVAGQPDTSALAKQICALSPTYSFSTHDESLFLQIPSQEKVSKENPIDSQTGNPRISRPSTSALFSQPSLLATKSKPKLESILSLPSDSLRNSRPNNSSTNSRPSLSAINGRPSTSATGSEVSQDARYSKPSQQGLFSLPQLGAFQSRPLEDSTRSLPRIPSSFSPPSNSSVFSLPRPNVSFSLPPTATFFSKPTDSILFSSPSGGSYFASNDQRIKTQLTKETLYSKNQEAMMQKPRTESLNSRPNIEGMRSESSDINRYDPPKSISINSSPNRDQDQPLIVKGEKEATTNRDPVGLSAIETDWTLMAAVQEPFSRFILNWWSQCVKPSILGEKSCYGCGENMTCLIEEIRERAWRLVDGEIEVLLKDQTISHFLPQNWQCDFARFPYHIVEYSEVGDVVPYIERALQNIIQLATRRPVSSALLSKDPLNAMNFDGFNEKLSEILESPQILQSIIHLYYHDFILFGFHGYFE